MEGSLIPALVLTCINLLFILILFLLFLQTLWGNWSERKELSKEKSLARVYNRIKIRASIAALCICVLELLILAGSLSVLLIPHALNRTPIQLYRLLLLSIEFCSVVLVNEILLGIARVFCSSLVQMVVNRIPNKKESGRRVEYLLVIAELTLIAITIVPKVAADVYYFSGSHYNAARSTHTPGSIKFKFVADKIFDAGITCNAILILICSISFTCSVSHQASSGKKLVYRAQTLVCSCNIYFFFRTIANMIQTMVIQKTSFKGKQDWSFLIVTLLQCILLLVQYLLIHLSFPRTSPKHQKEFQKEILEQSAPSSDETSMLTSDIQYIEERSAAA